jgi:superfamily II DNA/RNA helicase
MKPRFAFVKPFRDNRRFMTEHTDQADTVATPAGAAPDAQSVAQVAAERAADLAANPQLDAPPPKFDTVALDAKLLRAVHDSGYTAMTPIQAKAIPIVLAGRDVMGAAQTGTGKTAAFTLPLLQKMMKHETASMSPARHPVRALVLAPTRELADQVANNVKTYAKHTLLRSMVVFGGIDMKPQTAELKKGVEVLIATPGRLLDHIEAKNCSLGQVEYVVLDEADRMLDIGFLPDLQRILSYLPKQRQTLLFSATFSPEIKKLAQSYLQDPILVEVARANATASTVEQRFYSLAEDDKRRAVIQIIRQRAITQAIVFVNSKLGAARLARSFERDGLKTAALHGDKSQDERLKSLEAFKRGEVEVLVATDVAARGLDIADLPAVFNFDVPFNAEDYVHRIGRTGRAGASGVAITLVDREDGRLIAEVEKLLKKKIELEPFELEDDRPKRAPYRPRDDGDGRTEPAYVPREARAPRETPVPRDGAERPPREFGERPRRPSADPLFDKPYEPSAAPSTSPPAWEQKAAAPAPVRGLSPNIRTKRKVASLLGGNKA